MLYLDAADPDLIEPYVASGVFSGVTTNPTLLKQANRRFTDIQDLDRTFVAMGLAERFYQTVGRTPDQIMASARQILSLGEGVYVKIPAVGPGLVVANQLRNEPILLTAIYHPSQALLAQRVDADWIAPYVGRMDDIDGNGVAHTAVMHATLNQSNTKILAASIRSTSVVTQLLAVGIRHFTVSPALAQELLNQPAAIAAWEAFERDATSGVTV